MKLHIKPFHNYQIGHGYSLSCAEGLTAHTGSVTVVTGDSGSGKSILLKVLAGYRRERIGSTDICANLICEQDGPSMSFPDFRRRGSHFSFLPQESVLRPYLTPSEAVDAWCKLLIASCKQDTHAAARISSLKEDLIHRLFSAHEQEQLFDSSHPPKIFRLSGGQRRRLDVLMALCSPAEVVLLDEPDTGLDGPRRHALLDALMHVASQQHKIVIMVSHAAMDDSVDSQLTRWQVTRHQDGTGAELTMWDQAPCETIPMHVHESSDERGNLRLDHFLIYVQQRLKGILTGKGFMTLLSPFLLMAFVRLAIFPNEITDGPSMALLFFFTITCFWIGTIQSTGFWSEENVFFHRECRQGASTLAYLLSFISVLSLSAGVQTAAASVVVKYLNWSSLLSVASTQSQPDLQVGFWRLYGWGYWAALNGGALGLFWCTIQYRWVPRITSPSTAQLIALCITLTAIVFSFPIIGRRAYAEMTEDVHSPDRLQMVGSALRHANRTDLPIPAIILAELPVGVNPSFHGLWFQAERPMRYQVSETQLDNMQKHGVPAGSWNFAVLAALFSVILFQAWRLKWLPVER